MHLHIEGALPHAMLKGLDADKYANAPASWTDGFKFSNFEEFDEALLGMAMPWYNSPERYAAAAKEIFEILRAQNVRYLETSFASGMVEFLGVPGDEIAEAMAKAAPEGMDVKVFMGIHRGDRPKAAGTVLEDALSWKYLDGIDMHGNEKIPLESWAPDYWREAKKRGLHTKAHAGEFGGNESVTEVLDKLGVSQIEHGVRAVEDEALLERLAAERILLDVCPTSNVKLGIYKSYGEHPLKTLIARGVPCTLNSDDPLVFGTGINDEYMLLMEKMGFNIRECLELVKCGWRFAKIDAAKKSKMISEIEKIEEGLTDD